MHRNVTAVYRTPEVAELVRRGLEDIGVPARDIHVIPGSVDAGTTGSHPLQGSGALSDPADMDRLHDLHLPDEDLRTYQHCVQSGDSVVSAEVDDEDGRLDKVKAVMRRPETEVYDIEHRASEFRERPLIAHSTGDGRVPNEGLRARRLAASDDPYARTYERDRRLGDSGRI